MENLHVKAVLPRLKQNNFYFDNVGSFSSVLGTCGFPKEYNELCAELTDLFSIGNLPLQRILTSYLVPDAPINPFSNPIESYIINKINGNLITFTNDSSNIMKFAYFILNIYRNFYRSPLEVKNGSYYLFKLYDNIHLKLI